MRQNCKSYMDRCLIRGLLKVIYYCDTKFQNIDIWKHQKLHKYLMFQERQTKQLVFRPWVSFATFLWMLLSLLFGEYDEFFRTIVGLATLLLFGAFCVSVKAWYDLCHKNTKGL